MMSFGFFRMIAICIFATAIGAFDSAGPVAAFQSGIASYYKDGKVTANGEAFNPYGMTAAHRTLPFGTRVKVDNPHTGRAVVVRNNDRGPFIPGRIIDLALGAADKVGLTRAGIARVTINVLN
jgi:rare lipoprotein A